jgi:hypothetical protein
MLNGVCNGDAMQDWIDAERRKKEEDKARHIAQQKEQEMIELRRLQNKYPNL